MVESDLSIDHVIKLVPGLGGINVDGYNKIDSGSIYLLVYGGGQSTVSNSKIPY